jgi:phosphatidylserine/phosphatidylglycerophosphate/cardiolipin synthase-like enzyme
MLAMACLLFASSLHAAPADVEVAFTPGDDIEGLLVERIGKARSTIRIQAYLFTDRHLANALLAALKRGVKVELIGDAAQQDSGGLPVLSRLKRAGADVYVNDSLAASHNKILIIDAGTPRATVITGSYNFTHAAQSKNAENVVLITGSRELADRFLKNFAAHKEQSKNWP